VRKVQEKGKTRRVLRNGVWSEWNEWELRLLLLSEHLAKIKYPYPSFLDVSNTVRRASRFKRIGIWYSKWCELKYGTWAEVSTDFGVGDWEAIRYFDPPSRALNRVVKRHNPKPRSSLRDRNLKGINRCPVCKGTFGPLGSCSCRSGRS